GDYCRDIAVCGAADADRRVGEITTSASVVYIEPAMATPSSTSKAEYRRLTESLLSDIIAIAADAIICVDAEQRITLFNDGAEKIFGWTADEVMGRPLDMLLHERFR